MVHLNKPLYFVFSQKRKGATESINMPIWAITQLHTQNSNFFFRGKVRVVKMLSKKIVNLNEK